jgi:hypothetical protein
MKRLEENVRYKTFQRKRGKAEMVWTCNKKRWRRAGQRHYEMKISEDVGW